MNSYAKVNIFVKDKILEKLSSELDNHIDIEKLRNYLWFNLTNIIIITTKLKDMKNFKW